MRNYKIMESNLLYSEFIKEPIKILDVGANEHQEEFLSGLAPYCEIHAVQPFDKDFFKLKKNQNLKVPYKNLIAYNLGLAESNGKKVLNITKHSGASSFYEPNKKIVERWRLPSDKSFDVEKKISVDCITLAEFFKISNLKSIDFANLTANASELDIFKGAGNLIKNISIIKTQVEFVKIWENQEIFDDLLSHLRKYGFRLIHFLEMGEIQKKKIRGKAIFILEKFNDNDRLLRAAVILVEMGLQQEAKWILMDHGADKKIYEKLLTSSLGKTYNLAKAIYKMNFCVKSFTSHIWPLEWIRLKVVKILKKTNFGNSVSKISEILKLKK